MAIELFGFSIGKTGKESAKPVDSSPPSTTEGSGASFVAPDDYDGTINIEAGGVFGTYVDFDAKIQNENELIQKYRSMSLFPEVDMAITDIVNDAIVIDEEKEPVSILLDDVDLSDNIKNKIQDEFKTIVSFEF